MIIIPMATSSIGDGNVTNKKLLSMLIVFNFLLLISFGIMYYLFTKDSFVGTFWDWSWDMKYFLKDGKTNAGLAWMFFWLPFFIINGLAIIIYLMVIVESILSKK